MKNKALFYSSLAKLISIVHFLNFAQQLVTNFRLKVRVNYDDSFLGKFGNESVNMVRKVANHAGKLFLLPSLVQPLFWEFELGRHIPKTIRANRQDL